MTNPTLTSQNHGNPEDNGNVASPVSKYQSWGGELFAPQKTNPTKSDTSIVPAVVLNVIPSTRPANAQEETDKIQNSKMSKITNLFKRDKKNVDEGQTRLTKVVFMPLGDYKKWFAKDDEGVYIGTEPSREWTEDELNERFGAYRPAKSEEGGHAGRIDRMLHASARGL